MNERLTELYRASKPKEALASQDEFKSANVLLGSDVAKFAQLIVAECAKLVEDNMDPQNAWITPAYIKEHFGVK